MPGQGAVGTAVLPLTDAVPIQSIGPTGRSWPHTAPVGFGEQLQGSRADKL